MAADFSIGESLVGDGNEIAHIDLIIGRRPGRQAPLSRRRSPVTPTASRRCSPSSRPNLPCKPDTLLFNKVTIKGAKQAVQMFGPAQAAVARAVMDSVSEGVISEDPGRRPGHPGRRVHPLAGRRRQEDLPVQLHGGEGVDRPRARRARRPSTRCSQKYKAARHPFASGAEG